jgi:hypothetical protein
LTLGIPEGASLKTDNFKTCTSKPLQQNAASGANADDGVINQICIAEPSWRKLDLLHGADALDVGRMMIRFKRTT